MQLIGKIWLCYGIISIVLTAFLVIIITTSHLFQQSFYRLIAIHLVIVIISWINSWTSRIVYTRDYSFFAKALFGHSPELFNFFMFCGLAFLHLQSCSSIVICINKLRTANPEKFEKRNQFWNRWCLLIYGVLLALSCLAAKYLAVLPTVHFWKDTGKFEFSVLSLGDAIINIFLVAVFLILYILIGLICGLIAICKIRKHKKDHEDHVPSSVVTVSYTFFRVFCLALLLASFFMQIENFTVQFMFTIFDFMSFSLTFILLFFDDNFKMALKGSIK
ncbi:Serpentine receptor class gamma [Caenorhabditis elegans]|uniref:Serpentine receptor class gamma n=1 Tax=Caenorhabditis elegans TaxID=6239 RepID=Q86B42_CAEEL|nr:Serpentine receptor class gamma [Caenorhabditis elegans]CCD74050.1 Serpentine receptor class gamma [Caenorhabditis elegans]|eukprot:NP_872110.1 Serpentine receptor class gamma [Caenorhabditis elegans]